MTDDEVFDGAEGVDSEADAGAAESLGERRY